MTKFVGFPETVNDTSARIVAAGAVSMAVLYSSTGWGWVLVPLTYGFVARVLSGPRFSPLGLLATRIITPRLNRIAPKIVPGPPKRFAQGIGATFTVTSSVLFLLGFATASRVVVAMLAGAASLEAAFGYCIGCKVFGFLIRLGVVPESVCEACNDISLRVDTSARSGQPVTTA